jgi:hypothetical protein
MKGAALPIRPSDTIAGATRGTAAAALAFARTVGSNRLDQVEGYLNEAYALAPRVGIDPAIVVAQSALETDNWRDRPWSDRLNPAGMGVTPNHDFGHAWNSGADAARGQIVHLWLYARGKPLPDALAPHAQLDPRRDAIPQAQFGNARTLESLGGKWAGELDYGQRIANRALNIFPNLPNQTEVPTMAMQKHRFVGLDADVLLPDDIEILVDIVPDSKIGWVRSGIRETGQTNITFHDTGTAGSTARNQRNYLHGGPTYRDEDTGEIKRRKVGFNFAVDDARIIQLTPLNEQTWAAGTAQGNRISWHVEQCFGGSINFDRSLRNAIALHAGLIAAKGLVTDSALVKHQHWYGKYCPAQVLNKGLWNSVLSQVDTAARAIAGGGGGAPAAFADPVPVPELEPFRNGDPNNIPAMVKANDGTPFFFVADRVKAARPTPRLQRANPNSPRVGPDLAVDEEFDVMWIFESSADNDLYYITPFNTRIRVTDTVRVGDRPGPAPDPMEDVAVIVPEPEDPLRVPAPLLPDPGPAADPGNRGLAGPLGVGGEPIAAESEPDREAPGH